MPSRSSRPSAVCFRDCFIVAVCLAVCLGAVSACSGQVESADSASRGRVRQAETAGTPLYTIVDRDAAFAAAVDDASNLYVLSFLPLGSSDRESPPLYGFKVFDPSGNSVASTPVDSHDRVTLGSLRVRDATVALGGHYGGPAYDRPKDVAPIQMRLYAYTTSGRRLFVWTGPSDTSVTSLDVCGDGSIAAAGHASGGTLLVRLDGSGNVLYQASVPGTMIAKVRCDAIGTVIAGGSTTDGNAYAVAASYAPDGTPRWIWTGGDAGAAASTFDLDDAGDIVLAGTRASGSASAYQVYAIDATGHLRWSWTSDGPADALSGASVDSAGDVVVAGARGTAGMRHFFTVRLNAAGDVVWRRDDPGLAPSGADATPVGVSIDDAGDAFVCGNAGALVQSVQYGVDGWTQWTYAAAGAPAFGADVTGGIARCIAAGSGHALGVVAFQVP